MEDYFQLSGWDGNPEGCIYQYGVKIILIEETKNVVILR